jgi:hypothetical protein
MKRLLSGILLTCILIRLTSSCATKMPSESISNMGSGKDIPKGATGISSPVKIDTFCLDILPPSSGVQFYRDGIVFLSSSKNEGKMLPGHLSFGTAQAYYSEIKDSATGQHMIFSPSVPFPYPCEALAFTNDFNTMYFTRISEADKREKIYHAEFVSPGNNQQGWMMDSEPLSFCKNGSNYSHPAVSASGNIMIFASDNPGSSGGMDLFITRKINEKWNEPENLGIPINTKGNELFPFLDNDNNLFFSSDGLSGFGGYDIFVSKFNGNAWDIPVNLSGHINSKIDEIAFTMNRIEGNQAFFTTRQKSRNGEMKLYKLSLREGINSKDLSGILYSMALSEIDSNYIRLAKSNLEAEKLKADRTEAERIAAEKLKADNLENERIAAAKLKADNLEAERIAAVKLKADNLENERIAAAKLKADNLEAQRTAAAKLKADNLEAQRIKAERIKTEKLRTDSIEAARIEAERIRNLNLQADRTEAARIEAERIRARKLKADSIAAAKKESDRLLAARIKTEKDKTDSIKAARLEAYNKENKDVVIYKVQIWSSIKPKAKTKISVNGEKYIPDEYFYLKEYRYTIGEFNTLKPAVELQNVCRKSGLPQAFVAAFKNGSRTLDPAVFK